MYKLIWQFNGKVFIFAYDKVCCFRKKNKLETVTAKLSVYNAILSATLLEKSQCFSNYG